MIESGHAKPHHGHDKRAVAASAELADADKALLEAAAAADKVATKTAEKARAEKRAAQAARHEAERAARRPAPRKKA